MNSVIWRIKNYNNYSNKLTKINIYYNEFSIEKKNIFEWLGWALKN